MGNRAEEKHQLEQKNRFLFPALLNHKNHHQLLQLPYDIPITMYPSDDGVCQKRIHRHHKILMLSEPFLSTNTRCAAPGGAKQANGMYVARSINQKLGECDYSSSDNAAAFFATVCPARRASNMKRFSCMHTASITEVNMVRSDLVFAPNAPRLATDSLKQQKRARAIKSFGLNSIWHTFLRAPEHRASYARPLRPPPPHHHTEQ